MSPKRLYESLLLTTKRVTLCPNKKIVGKQYSHKAFMVFGYSNIS